MMEKELELAGLSGAEARVYLALLKIGSCTSGAVIKETSLRKSTIYECTGRLMEKGLGSFVIKNNVKFFEAANPSRLIDFLDEKKRLLDKEKTRVKKILPKLMSIQAQVLPRAEAHVFFGVEGFKTMRRDVLKNAGGELLMLGAIYREPKAMPVFWNSFNKERIKREIRLKILYQQSAKMGKDAGKFLDQRFLPKDVSIPAVINVYGDRVINIVWKENYPICFMLINKSIADSYRKYFELLWKMSSKK